MALDWKKEVSLSSLKGLFGGKKGASKGSTAYPTKVTMNLYQGDTKTTSLLNVVIVGVILAVAIALFVKFGVIDQLALVSQKQGELAEQQSTLMSFRGSVEDYDEIKELYDSYMVRYGEGSSDAISVLDLVEQHVKNVAQVTSIVLSEDTLTLTLYDVPLDSVGNLAKDLEGQDLVSSVHVSTATTADSEGQNTVSTLVVTLNGFGDEEE